MGPVSKSRFKNGLDKSKIEDGEFSDTLRKAELLDNDNCTWLSSDGASSPSSCYKDKILSSCHADLKIDAWFISLLSTPTPTSSPFLTTQLTFFDGSRVNPIEEASLVLDQIIFSGEKLTLHDNLNDKEVVSWLTDSSDTCSLFSSSSSSDYSSEVMDLEEIEIDKPLFWPSDWQSEWGSETTKWDFFVMSPRKNMNKARNSTKTSPHLEKNSNRRLMFTQSDSASPMHKSFDTSSDYASEVLNLEHTSTKTPIFWPSSCAPDTKWDFLVMSPRNYTYKVGKSPQTSPDTLRLRVLNGNTNTEKGCNRRLEFSAMSTKTVDMRDEDEVAKVKVLNKNSKGKHKVLLEDLLLVDKLNVEPAIEKVLGLDEFDGHEGVESGFNKDDFSLVDIL